MKTQWSLLMANNSMKNKLTMDELVMAIKTANDALWLHLNQALVETPASYLIDELAGSVSKQEIKEAYQKFSFGMHNDELESWLDIKHS